MIPFRLEYTIEQTLRLMRLSNASRERRVIKKLTGLRIPESQATEVWSSILLHKWYLGERLNRDVGLRTAAVDYLENIAQSTALGRGRQMFSLRNALLKSQREKTLWRMV